MEDALNIFQENRFSGAPVVNENGLVGLLSIEDIIRALRRGQVDARVHECMTTKLITVNKYDPVIEALKTFSCTSLGVCSFRRIICLRASSQRVTSPTVCCACKKTTTPKNDPLPRQPSFEDIVSARTSLILRYGIRKGDFIHSETLQATSKGASSPGCNAQYRDNAESPLMKPR